MGSMTSCMSGINSYTREVQFNLKNSPSSYNLKEKRKYQLQKQRNNSQIFIPKENNNKIKGRSNSNSIIRKETIENSEDFCDIIEGEDEFECKKNISYLPIQNLIINNIPKKEESIIIKDYYDKDSNLNCSLGNNINLFRISKPNNISFYYEKNNIYLYLFVASCITYKGK